MMGGKSNLWASCLSRMEDSERYEYDSILFGRGEQQLSNKYEEMI